MDPQACLEIIYGDNEHRASSAAENLHNWLLEGGYMPRSTGHLSRLNNALRAHDRDSVLVELSALIALDPIRRSPRP